MSGSNIDLRSSLQLWRWQQVVRFDCSLWQGRYLFHCKGVRGDHVKLLILPRKWSPVIECRNWIFADSTSAWATFRQGNMFNWEACYRHGLLFHRADFYRIHVLYVWVSMTDICRKVGHSAASISWKGTHSHGFPADSDSESSMHICTYRSFLDFIPPMIPACGWSRISQSKAYKYLDQKHRCTGSESLRRQSRHLFWIIWTILDKLT